MNSFIRKPCRFIAFIAILLRLATSCASPPGAEATGTVLVRVSDGWSGSRGVVHDPAPPLGELTVLLDGAGPGDTAFSSAAVAGGSLELNLVAGAWVFSARALNADGLVILSGSASGRVDAALGASVSIILSPPEGSGVVSISYAVPPEAPAGALWRCVLADAVNSPVQAWDDDASVPGRVLAAVPSGYYSLSACLLDGAAVLAGSTDLVRVLDGLTTTVSVAAAIPEAEAALGFSFDDRSPLAVTASVLCRAVVRGFPLRLQANAPSGAVCRWSVLGSVLAEGSIVDISTTGLPRSGRVDLGVFSGSSAGAAELAFVVEEPALRAGYSVYAAVTAVQEPGSQVLSRPAMLSASANGTMLGAASDGTSSKAEIWKLDPASNEMEPVSSLAIKIGGSARKATMLALSPDGGWLAAANSESGWIWTVPVGADGILGTPTELVGGSAGLEGLGYLRGLCFSPDGSRLYALSNADRSVYALELNGGVWAPVFRTALDEYACGVLSVLKAMALSPSGATLTVAAAGSDAVVFFDTGTSMLAWRGEARLNAGCTGLDYPQALAFSPDGASLAVACKDSSSLLVIDAATCGQVSQALFNAGNGFSGVPQALAYAHDGSALGVTLADGLVVLGLPAEPGSPVFGRFDTADSPALATPLGLTFANDAFYTASPDGAALVIIGTPEP